LIPPYFSENIKHNDWGLVSIAAELCGVGRIPFVEHQVSDFFESYRAVTALEMAKRHREKNWSDHQSAAHS
jgi:hypothetical protein